MRILNAAIVIFSFALFSHGAFALNGASPVSQLFSNLQKHYKPRLKLIEDITIPSLCDILILRDGKLNPAAQDFNATDELKNGPFCSITLRQESYDIRIKSASKNESVIKGTIHSLNTKEDRRINMDFLKSKTFESVDCYIEKDITIEELNTMLVKHFTLIYEEPKIIRLAHSNDASSLSESSDFSSDYSSDY